MTDTQLSPSRCLSMHDTSQELTATSRLNGETTEATHSRKLVRCKQKSSNPILCSSDQISLDALKHLHGLRVCETQYMQFFIIAEIIYVLIDEEGLAPRVAVNELNYKRSLRKWN